MRMSSRVFWQTESILGVKKGYRSCPKAEQVTVVDMKINKIRNICLVCGLIGYMPCFPIANLCDFWRQTQIPAKILRFFGRNFVVRLIEVLLDVLVLVGDLGPHLHVLLDA